MAFADDQDDESGQDPNAARAQPRDQSDPTAIGGGGTGVVGGGPSAAPATQSADSNKPSSSGSWTNLQSYLDANADQGQKVGQDIAGSISDQANKGQKETEDASSDFMNGVNAGTVKTDQSAIDKAIADAQSGNLTDADQAAFSKQYGANYGGPTDFTKDSSYAQAGSDLTNAQNSLAQTGSEAGRDVLLGNQYQNTSAGGYNQGEKNLDQMLLEGNPGNQATFSNLQNQWSGIGNVLGDATTKNNAAAAQAAQTDAATKAAASGSLDTANTGFQSTLQQQLAAQQAAYQNANSQIKNDFSNGQLTPDELSQLGATNGDKLYNLNLNDYVTPGQNPTLANTATAQQYAESAALAQLAGATNPYLNPASASQAGTAGNPYTINGSGFQSAQAAAAAQWQANYNDKLTAAGLNNPPPQMIYSSGDPYAHPGQAPQQPGMIPNPAYAKYQDQLAAFQKANAYNGPVLGAPVHVGVHPGRQT